MLERRFLDAVKQRIFRAREFPVVPIRPDDRAYLLGQTLVELIKKGGGAKDIVESQANQLVQLAKHEEKNFADTVFLSMLAYEGDEQIAFTLFSTFCDLIPAERLYQILQLESQQVKKFKEMFLAKPMPITKAYVEYVREVFNFRHSGPARLQWYEHQRKIEMYARLNRALIDGVSPLTFSLTTHESPSSKIQVDLFDILNELTIVSYNKHFVWFSPEVLLTIQKTLFELPEEQKLYARNKFKDYLGGEITIDDLTIAMISVMTNKYLRPGWPKDKRNASNHS